MFIIWLIVCRYSFRLFPYIKQSYKALSFLGNLYGKFFFWLAVGLVFLECDIYATVEVYMTNNIKYLGTT